MDANKFLHVYAKHFDCSAGDDGTPKDAVKPPKSGASILTSIRRRVDSLLRTGSAVTAPSNTSVVLPAVASHHPHHRETAGDALRRKSLEHAHAGHLLPREMDGMMRPAPGVIKFTEGTHETRRITSPRMQHSSRRNSSAGDKGEKQMFVRRGSADSSAAAKNRVRPQVAFTRSKSDGCDRSG